MRRFYLTTLLLLLLIALPITLIALRDEQDTRSSAQAKPAGFVYREGTKLMLNGKEYKTASFNSFQLSSCGNANQIPSDAQIETLFGALPDNIMIRTWAFPGDEEKLDKVIKAAERHNIKLLLSLGDGRSHCGHTDGAPGGDGSGKTPAWYASGYKGTYLSHVTKMTSTYKNSTAIGMWEIVNEASDSDAGGTAALKSFFDTVAAEIKKNDPNHLVTSGTFPPYAYDGEEGYKLIHSGPNIDVGSIHEYDYDHENSNTIESPHFQPALNVMKSLNKPLIVGETGINAAASGCRTNLQTRSDAMKQKFDVYLSKGASGVFAWNYAQEPDNCGSTFGATDPMVSMIKTYQANLDAANINPGGASQAPTTTAPTFPQPTDITPTLFCLGGVPCYSPAPTNGTTTTPPVGGTNPTTDPNVTGTVTPISNPNPTVSPCESNDASIQHSKKKKHKKNKRGGGGWLSKFIDFLIKLIMMLFGMPVQPGPVNPNPVPEPTPCPEPTTEAPTIEPTVGDPTGEPTVEPTLSESPTTEPSITETPVTNDAQLPSQVLNLDNWKLTLPSGASEKPTEILQPTLDTYKNDPFFLISGGAVKFRAPVNGVTTSSSGYPRSELREMTDNGKKLAAWSNSSGTHTMFIDQAITAVPATKKHVVAGQIHDGSDDVIVIRLEDKKLFVDIGGKDGPTLDANYTLGKRFTVKFEATGGKTNIYYNGSTTPAHTLSKSYSGAYFKAGAYTQSNCSTDSGNCSANNYGEVIIYKLEVTHN